MRFPDRSESFVLSDMSCSVVLSPPINLLRKLPDPKNNQQDYEGVNGRMYRAQNILQIGSTVISSYPVLFSIKKNINIFFPKKNPNFPCNAEHHT